MANNALKQQTKKAVYWSFIGNFANQGMQFVIGLVLARLLSPSDYGIIAMPMVFLAIAQCFINSGFGSALIRKPDLTEEDLSTAFYFNIIVGIFFYLLFFFASPLIADFYNVPILADILKVTALSTLFGPLQSVHFALFSKRLDFKTPAKISMLSKFTTGIVGIILAYRGWGIWALVFQGVTGQVLSLVLVWYWSSWRPKTGWSWNSFHYLFGFGSNLLMSSIIDTIYDNITPLVIGKFYSPADLGVYNRGMSYASLPQKQISGILNRVSFPVLSKLQYDDEKLFFQFQRILKTIIFILAPVEMMLSALARPLILLTITDKWESCIIILQLLCFAVILWPIQSLNMSLFQVKGRSDLVLKANLSIRISLFVLLVATLPFGIVIISVGAILRAIVAIGIVTHYTDKLFACGHVQQFKPLIPSFLLSLAMYVLVTLLNLCIDSYLLQIICGLLMGSSFYIGMAYLLRLSAIDDVKFLLRLRKSK